MSSARTYWIVTVPFLILLLFVSFAYLAKQSTVVEAMLRMGYPLWVLNILSVAILLGIAAIATNKNNRFKEWAYAGFTFHFIGASASHALSGDHPGYIIAPLGLLLWCWYSYFLWHKLLKKVLLNKE